MSPKEQIEQLEIAIGALAELLSMYYEQLKMHGFSDEQAMEMVLGLQSTMLKSKEVSQNDTRDC